MKKIFLPLLIALATAQAVTATCHHNSITGNAIFDTASTGGGNLTLLMLLGFASFVALITLGIIDRK